MPLCIGRPRAAARRLPRHAFVALLATGACGAACSDATAPLPSGGAPRELSYATGGFVGTTYEAHLAGDTVVLTTRTTTPSGPQVATGRRVPAADEWRRFWSTVDAAGVRRWPGECRDTSGQDSAEFTFTLAWDGGRRSGTYVNFFPTGQGTCTRDPGRSNEAALFRWAVFALAGLYEAQALDGA